MPNKTRNLGVTLAGVLPSRSTGSEQFEESIQIAHTARDAGFGYLVFGQHFLASPLQYLHPIPTLARLAPETGDMHLAVGIMLLSMVNPVDAADQLATLDVISGGRLVLGVGMGYRDEELRAFGVDRKDRSPRMLEALEVMQKLWTGEPIDHQGRFFTVKADGASLRPLQRPGPPTWMAAMTPKTLERAARMGMAPYIGPSVPISKVAEWLPMYRELTGDPAATAPVRRDVFVVSDRKQAWEMSAPFIEEKYQLYLSQGFDPTLADAGSLRQAISERVIVGDIDDCSAMVKQYFEMGASPLILRCQWPSLDVGQVVKMVEDIGHAVDAL